MLWIAPTEKDTATVISEKRLFFLRFAEHVCRRRPHGNELCSECICP